jgi:hypothetical protein
MCCLKTKKIGSSGTKAGTTEILNFSLKRLIRFHLFIVWGKKSPRVSSPKNHQNLYFGFRR